MTRVSPRNRLAAACCVALLAAPTAPAQTTTGTTAPGIGTTGGGGPVLPGSTTTTLTPTQQQELLGQLRGFRQRQEQTLQGAGLAPAGHEERQQIQTLNELSRQLAPDVPVPAPELASNPRPATRR